MKKLSIIIPAYNVEKCIVRTLSSIMAQNDNSIEIIVVNDGSTDHTEDVVRKMIENSHFQNISIYTKANGGVSSARNYGLDEADGKFVLFLDGDDYVQAGFVDSMLDLADKHEAHIIHWPYDLVDEAGNILSQFPYHTEEATNRTGADTLNGILLERSTRIWTGSIAYSRGFLIENKIRYTSGCAVGEDLEFIFKSLSHAQSVLFTDRLRSFYLQRPASVINTYSVRKFDAVLALGRVRDYLLGFGTPAYHLLAKHFDEYEILHSYTGTYRMCLEHLIREKKMPASAAIRQLAMEIENMFPGMNEDISSMLKAKKRSFPPDRIDIFRISPLLYMHLARVSEKKVTSRGS